MYAGTYDGWFRGRADYGEYHHGPYGLLQPDGWGSGTVGFPACPALPVRCVFHRRGRVRFQENQTGRYLKASKRNAARPMWADGYFFRSNFFGRTFTVGGGGSSLIIFSHFLKS